MSILIIVYHFWPKSLKWPFRLRLFLTKYYYFRANFNILRRNIAIFDRRKLFYLIWPFLTKTWSIAISPRFWPFLTVFGHFDYFCREFDYFWPNRAICDQFLTISDFFLTKLVIFDRMIIFENDHSKNVRFESSQNLLSKSIKPCVGEYGIMNHVIKDMAPDR